MTLNPVCENVETAQGVPLTVTGVAQVKIMKNADLLQTASEQFLGKKEHEIKSTVLQTLEGHLRAILGKQNVYSFEKGEKNQSSCDDPSLIFPNFFF
jgi:flotillin